MIFLFLLLVRKITLLTSYRRDKYFRILPNVSFYRYNLPIVIIVVNNNGIYTGLDANSWEEMLKFGDPATW